MQTQFIQQKIFEIRGQKVMLDFDLAALYEVETRVFNQAVKRNMESFPEDFMFRLTREMRSQIVIAYSESSDNQSSSSSQNVIALQKKRNISATAYAFTEHGVTMLASILKSTTARKMNIAIVRAFIAMRKTIVQYSEVVKVIEDLKERISGHDAQLNQIYEALENMLDKKADEEMKLEAWKNRKQIGFKR